MVTFRPYEPEQDRDFVLGIHVQTVFEAESAAGQRHSFPQFRDAWFATGWPATYLDAIQRTMADLRTIAEVVQLDGVEAGFVWATTADLLNEDQPLYFQVRELVFAPAFQRQGLGRLTMQHVEDTARDCGATTLRSIGGARTEGGSVFHRSLGFEPHQIVWEKRL